jgi:hypothetical protein
MFRKYSQKARECWCFACAGTSFPRRFPLKGLRGDSPSGNVNQVERSSEARERAVK